MILPDRVTVEVVNWLHVLVKVNIRSEGHIGVVSRLEVGHAAGGYAEAPQHWKQQKRECVKNDICKYTL